MAGKLRDIAAVDHDQVRFQFDEFSLDRAMQLRLGKGGHRERPPCDKRCERTQLARPPIQRDSGYAPRIIAEPGNVIEIAATVAEAEDVDLVLCREVTDLVEGGDFVTPVRRERHPLAYEENSHRRTSVGPPAGMMTSRWITLSAAAEFTETEISALAPRRAPRGLETDGGPSGFSDTARI